MKTASGTTRRLTNIRLVTLSLAHLVVRSVADVLDGLDLFDAEWLMRQTFPDVRYVVDGVIPEGLTMLVAAPKIGKSWMVLGLGLGLASGGTVLGKIPAGEPRPTLYLALEDGKRRLQSRIRSLGIEPSRYLMFVTELPKGDIIAAATQFMELNRHRAPVLILDTLGKSLPPATSGETQYERDYRIGSELKAVADGVPGSSVIVVHHSRKADAADFLDAVSGTQGLAGSADTILVLKRERNKRSAILHVTSRDAAEGEYALTIEPSGSWILDGADLAEASANATIRRSTQGVGDRMAEVIATVSRFPEGIAPKNLKALLPDVSGLDEYLRRAVDSGRLEKLQRGLYGPVRSVRTVSLEEDPGSPNSHTHSSHTPLRLVGGGE